MGNALAEGAYPIVEATLYLATAPKSNSAGAYFYEPCGENCEAQVRDRLARRAAWRVPLDPLWQDCPPAHGCRRCAASSD